MRTGRPASPIELDDKERCELLRHSRQRKAPAETRIRDEIILACAAGESATATANRLHTVSYWRVRFNRLRLYGLNGKHRSDGTSEVLRHIAQCKKTTNELRKADI